LKSLQKEGKILHRGRYYCGKEFEEELEMKLQEIRKELQAVSSAHSNNIAAGLLYLISNQFLEGGEALKPLPQYAQRALEHLKSGYETIFAKCIKMLETEKRKRELVENLEKSLEKSLTQKLMSAEKWTSDTEWTSDIVVYLLSIGSYHDTKASQEFFSSRNLENLKSQVEGFVRYQIMADYPEYEVRVRGLLVADRLTQDNANRLTQAIKNALSETIASETYIRCHEDNVERQKTFQDSRKEFENNVQRIIRKIATDKVEDLKGICEVCYEQGFTPNEMEVIGEVLQDVFGYRAHKIFYSTQLARQD
jgi:protoporphyrinogen oxidase